MVMEKANIFSYKLFSFIIFITIYIVFKPNQIIGMDFFLLLLLFLIIYLVIFKRLHLIKNSFLLGHDGKKIIVGTAIFIVAFLILFSIKIGSFAPITRISGSSIYILFQTLTEELVFRVGILGMATEGAYLKPIKRFDFFYWAEGRKNSIILFLIILVLSVLFSNLHTDWVNRSGLLVIRSILGSFFAFSYVLTNKRIYAPWIIHYINNMYAA